MNFLDWLFMSPRERLAVRLVKSGELYKSREWAELRFKALTKWGRKCQICGKGAKDNAVLHVDHIKPISKYPRLALSFKNLGILCSLCNRGKSNKYQYDYR